MHDDSQRLFAHHDRSQHNTCYTCSTSVITIPTVSASIITVNIILIDALQMLSHAPRSEQIVVAEALK